MRRSGCGLLLDVNNIVVTAHNLRLDPRDWLTGLPGEAITEYHLAGHAVNDADGEPILIDDHGSRVGDERVGAVRRGRAALRPAADPDRMGHRHSGARRAARRGGSGPDGVMLACEVADAARAA